MVSAILIGNVAVQMVRPPRRLERAVAEMFSSCPPTTQRSVISVAYSERPAEVPDRAPDFRIHDVSRWSDTDSLIVRHSDGSTGEWGHDRIAVWVSPASADPVRSFRLALQYPLVRALGSHGRHGLHAAALERNGDALVAIGPTGAGKSTFAYGARGAGWNVLGDDLALLGFVNDALTLWGVPKSLSVPSDVVHRVPRQAARIVADARSRWSIPAEGLVRHGGYRLNRVVMLGHAPGRASHSVVTPSAALLKQIALSLGIGFLHGDARAQFRVAGAIIGMPMDSFCHDRDPDRRVDAIREFLKSVASKNRPSVSDSPACPPAVPPGVSD